LFNANEHILEVGANFENNSEKPHDINQRMFLSYGFFFLNAPVPDKKVNPLFPDFPHKEKMNEMYKNDGLLRVILNHKYQYSVGYRIWIRYVTVLNANKDDYCSTSLSVEE